MTGVFFNGRLIVTPTVASAVDDTAMANQNLGVGNVLALVGRALGGKPNTALRFGSPSEAIAALRGGDLLDAVLRAFAPSRQVGGPTTVVALRVNPAVAAALTLQDGTSANVIDVTHADYGLYTNQLKIRVEAGTNRGVRLTVQQGNDVAQKDDIARDAFKIRYSGAQTSATMTITETQVTLAAPAGSVVATIDLATYPTVLQLCDRINAVAGFSATVQEGSGDRPTLRGLDGIATQDVRSADYVATANLQAVVDWLNSPASPNTTAVRRAGAVRPPAALPFTFLTGGSDGNVTNTEWSNAFTTLQMEDVQWVVPVSTDPAIHAMADAHCFFMSTVMAKERRAIVGTALGTTDAQAIAAARALNSDRTSLVHLGGYDYDRAGNLTLYSPAIVAAMIGGAFAGVNPGTPLTNKSIALRGLERKLRNPTDTDQLILGGVLCLEETATGISVVKSISTWLTNDNYNRVEQSCGVATDFMMRAVREALKPLKGEKQTPILLSRAISVTETTLRQLAVPEPQGPAVLAGDAASPAYKNIRARIEGDVLRVEWEASPVIPCNYILATAAIQPYTGAAAALVQQ